MSVPRVVVGGRVYALRKLHLDPSRPDATLPKKERLPSSKYGYKKVDRPWVIGIHGQFKRLNKILNAVFGGEMSEDVLIREVEHARNYLDERLRDLPVKDPG